MLRTLLGRLLVMREIAGGINWREVREGLREIADLSAGQGGYNEDHEFYGYRMPI